MKRPAEHVQEDRSKRDTEYVHLNGLADVPREVWLWMEQQIISNDTCNRRSAQQILHPRDENMRYIIAVLKDGRSDAVGRNLRTTRHLNYNEKRPCAPRGGEPTPLGDDHGRIHHKAKWGWRLHEQMMHAFSAGK